MEPITIQYRLTEPEFMRACGSHWSAHRQGTMSNIFTGLLCLVVGLSLLFTTFRWIAAVFLVGGALLFIIVAFRSFMWRRAFRDAKKYNADISVVIRDDSVHVESAEGKSDLNWDFFTWYLDTPEHVLLYMTKRSFSVIPKSAFQDEQSVHSFMDLVKSRLARIR